MAKYLPHLAVLAPNTTLLSGAYGCTECLYGVAVSLLEDWRPLAPCQPQTDGGSGSGAGCESYVLLPHVSCFYEFVGPTGDTCRLACIGSRFSLALGLNARAE